MAASQIDRSDRSLLPKYFIYVVITIISIRLLVFVFQSLQPRVMAWFLKRFAHSSNKTVGKIKSKLFASMKQLKEHDRPLMILEIGAGTGANFQYFPESSKVTVLEPNVHCIKYLEESTAESSHDVDVIIANVEDIRSEDVPNESVDAVVCTYVLCSVDDTEKAMMEIKRVLKPNGRFYFVEHVRDGHYNSWTHISQRLMYPVMKFFADCNCNKNTWTFIERAGFKAINYRQVTGPKGFPVFVRPHMYGYATK